MLDVEKSLETLVEPADYFKGLGKVAALPTPRNILLFLRQSKDQLQQQALQNRSHHRFVLIFNLEAAGQVHANHHQIPLKPGQALLVFPFQFHHFSQLESQKLKWLICTFEFEKTSFLNPLRNRVIEVSKPVTEARDPLLQEWLTRAASPRSTELQDVQLQASMLKLLVALRGVTQEVASDSISDSQDNLLRNVNRLLEEWSGRQILVQHMAEELNLSESRFRFLFKAVSGISIGSYIQNYRINRAMALLRTSTLAVAEVATKAGFGSPQAFCRIFKQKTGFSPRVYRCNG